MGIDRHIIAKRDIKAGECVVKFTGASPLSDVMSKHEIFIELWRLSRLYDSDFEEYIEGIKKWFEEVKKREYRDVIFAMCAEHSGLEWRDE